MTSVQTVPNMARTTLLNICLLTALALILAPATAKSRIVGKYTRSSGNVLILQLDIPSPAPSSLILEQHLPQNVEVAKTSPPAQKINKRSGVIKWLLKGVRQGAQTVRIDLRTSIAPGNVWARLRYRNPADGKMVEQTIRP